MPVNPLPKQFVHGQILHSELRSPAFAHASYGIWASDFRAPNAGESCVIQGKRRKIKVTEKCLSASSFLRCVVYMED